MALLAISSKTNANGTWISSKLTCHQRRLRKRQEFRCPPKEQMFRLLKCKVEKEEKEVLLEDEVEDYCAIIVEKIGNSDEPNEEERIQSLIETDEGSWVDSLARLVVAVPPPATGQRERTSNAKKGTRLVQLQDAMAQTYVLHERNNEDVQDFIIYLIQIRELLTVQFEHTEEANSETRKLMNNRIFFQHPDLMRLLSVHENVMSIMMNILTAQQGAVEHEGEEVKEKTPIKDSSEMVVACSRFLCYFCRTSRQNQKAMFEHLSFLLDNATMLLARPSLRGSVPLDVAYSSFMDNNELALALKEEELDKVSRSHKHQMAGRSNEYCRWRYCQEAYIDFLRFCVWINGENVEENANLVIRLLIRRPECLGVALKGEGQGLFAAFKEAIALSEDIRVLEEEGDAAPMLKCGLLGDSPSYPSKEGEGEDYLDLGAATLDFYSSLVDLLAKCAPDRMAIQAGKGDSLRARAILRSLISLDDLGQILSLRFTIPNLAMAATDVRRRSFANSHQHNVNVTHSFAKLATEVKANRNRLQSKQYERKLSQLREEDFDYANDDDVESHSDYGSVKSHLDDDTKENKPPTPKKGSTSPPIVRSASKKRGPEYNGPLPGLLPNHKGSVLLFLDRVYGIDSQDMLFHFLEQSFLPDLRAATMMDSLMTLHYERCNKYYGSGNQYGVATEVEKRLSMLLFYAIFDSLGSRPYDPDLFGKALPCLTAIGSAISPDYTLTSGGDDTTKLKEIVDDSGWVPKTVDVSRIDLPRDLQSMTEAFAEHFHDSWASRKIEKGWVYGDLYSRKIFLQRPMCGVFESASGLELHIRADRSGCCRSGGQRSYAFRHQHPKLCSKTMDLSSMTLEKDMVSAGEKMAEHSHLIWAKKVWNDLNTKGGFLPTILVPWDLLTDFERRKDRFRATEILKFVQYHGYHVESPKTEQSLDRAKSEGERSSVEKRFAYNLLEKLINIWNKQQELTRRNTFRTEGQDVKFFEKVVLPLMHAYFNAHKNYFLEGSTITNSDIIRTSLLTFFNNCADDLFAAVKELK
ncbi:RIH domain protein, partial [Ostertagia ostertagi]